MPYNSIELSRLKIRPGQVYEVMSPFYITKRDIPGAVCTTTGTYFILYTKDSNDWCKIWIDGTLMGVYYWTIIERCRLISQ